MIVFKVNILGRALAFGAVLSSLALATASYATTITRTFTVEGHNFEPYFGPTPAPIDPLIGVYTITFDPSKTYITDSTDIIVHSLNFNALTTNFSWNPGAGIWDNTLFIGSKTVYDGYLTEGPGDYGILIQNFPTGPTWLQEQYWYSANAEYTTSNVSIVFAGGVPEPLTWTLLLLGLGSIGLVLRHGRSARLGSRSVRTA